IFRRLERQISNKYFFRHYLPIFCKGTSGTWRRRSKNNRRPVRQGASEHFEFVAIPITTTLHNTLNDKIINRVRSDLIFPLSTSAASTPATASAAKVFPSSKP